MNESMLEMERRIKELEHARTENDEYLQRLEAQTSDLIEALYTALDLLQANRGGPIVQSRKYTAEAALEKAIHVFKALS